MKKFLESLQKGQSIIVEVIEVQPDRQVLVNYRGQLFRVKNISGRRFDIGERIYLVCVHTNPLEFSLAGDQRLFSRMV